MGKYKNLGYYLKRERKIAEISQKVLASQLKIDFQFVSQWERGHCRPSPALFKKLTKILKIHKSTLITVVEQDAHAGAVNYVKKLYR